MKESTFDIVSIEKVSEFWDKRPCNIRHSPKPVGSLEYFEDVMERKYFVEPHIPGFAQFGLWHGKRVLEIGCGIGTDTISFAMNGAKVTAVELSNESLNVVRQRLKIYGLEHQVSLFNANAEELSKHVPAEPYDLIYSFGVIHHTPHPERVLEQIKKYGNKETTIKIMVYNRYSWKALWIIITFGRGRFWRLEELIAENSEAETGCPVTYAYSKKEIVRLLEQYGYAIDNVFIDHIFPYRIPDYVQYRYVKTWYIRWMPKQVFRWLEKHFGWHLCVTARIE